MPFLLTPFQAPAAIPDAENVLSGSTGVDGSGFTTASFSFTAGEKFIIGIGSSDNLAHAQTAPTSLTQTGITWTNLNDISYDDICLSVWEGVATTTSSSTLAVSFAGTQLSMTWGIVRLVNLATRVQSVEVAGQPSGYLDAPLAALQTGSTVILVAQRAHTGGAFGVRTGYTILIDQFQDSPNQYLRIHKGAVLPAGESNAWPNDNSWCIVGVEYLP